MTRRTPYAEKRAAGQRKAIHVLRRQLGLERDVYVSILQRVAGVESSTQLDDDGRDKVLDELRRLAGEVTPAPARPRKSYPGKPKNFDSHAMPETITKIEALLADMGLSWSYADSIAKRMFGVARVAWVRNTPDLAAIVAALHVEQEKRALLAEVERLRGALAMRDEEWARLTSSLRRGWQRHRPTLKAVAEWLAQQQPEKTDDAS